MPAPAPHDPRRHRSVGRWTLADAIDFEHLVRVGAAPDDARWYASEVVAVAGSRPDDRRSVLRSWLDRARARASSTPPGTRLAGGLRWLDVGVMVAGLLFGGGLAGGLLSGPEAEPINALLFLGATVGVQIAIVALALVAALARRAGLRIGLVRDAMLALARIAARVVADGRRGVDGARSADLAAQRAVFSTGARRSGPLVACRLLIVTQLFAIAFNVGLLAAMALVYLPFVELRFGWQTTYSFTADSVAACVRAIAAPWAWIAPGLVPNGVEVAATRYTRGQPATTLPAGAAHAWWPFLLCAIAFYGLMLRVVVAAIAAAVLQRHLARLSFAFPDANQLWRRLQGPLVTSRGGDERLPDAERAGPAARTGGVGLLVVDADLAAQTGTVRIAVERRFGDPVGPLVATGVDDDRLAPALAEALRTARGPIVVALASGRDPIVAVGDFLRAVVAGAGAAASVTVMLVGDREEGGGQRTAGRVAIWRRFVALQRLPMDVDTEVDAHVVAAEC